jgi:hypothetical protein
VHQPVRRPNDLEKSAKFCNRTLRLIWFSQCCLTLTVQAVVSDGLLFDAPHFSKDGFAASELDLIRGEVIDAFMGALVVGVIDKGSNGCFEFALEAVVFQQDALLQGLVPPFDFS